jgi:anti-anti-sigma factor
MPKQKIELTLPATLQFSSLLRHIAEDIFDYVGFTKEWSSRLKLVVDELFMNANRYASKENTSKIYILFEYDNTEVLFRIDDEGQGPTKVSAEKLRQHVDQNKEALKDLTKTSGRGLALISHLWTDEIIIEDSPRGGIAVSFKKVLTTEKPPAPPIPKVAPPTQEGAESDIVSPVAPQGPVVEVKVVGEIDNANIEEKVQPIMEEVMKLPKYGVLALDCSELVYFNSTFIGHLASWHNEVQKKEGQLILKNTSPEVKDVLSLVGLSKVIYLES